MSANTALLGYRESVAQERQRIAEVMASRTPGEQALWSQVKVTRKITLALNDRIVSWDAGTKQEVFAVELLRGVYDLTEGLSVGFGKLRRDSCVVSETFSVSTDPTHIGGGVFLAIDAIAPFASTGPKHVDINLLAYSSAGVKGEWSQGTVTGTEEEFSMIGKCNEL